MGLFRCGRCCRHFLSARSSCRMRSGLTRMMGGLRLLFRLWFVFLFLRAVGRAEERKTTN